MQMFAEKCQQEYKCQLPYNSVGICGAFVLFGQEPSLLWTPAHRPSASPVRLPLGERRGIGWCVQCVRDVQERRDK